MKRRARPVAAKNAEDKSPLKALREAAAVGIDDIEAGRFRTFASPNAVRRHFRKVADEVITARTPGKRK